MIKNDGVAIKKCQLIVNDLYKKMIIKYNFNKINYKMWW